VRAGQNAKLLNQYRAPTPNRSFHLTAARLRIWLNMKSLIWAMAGDRTTLDFDNLPQEGQIFSVRKVKDFQILEIDDFSDNRGLKNIANVSVAKGIRATIRKSSHCVYYF